VEIFANPELRRLEQVMAGADSYTEWLAAATDHDEISGADLWRKVEKTRLYDYAQIRKRLEKIRYHRERRDDQGLLFTLNEGIHGNMGGMGSPELFSRSHTGTKVLVEEYVAAIREALEHIAGLDDSVIPFEERLDFFRRASHCYGRTALMLSGGGALGHFHVGVIKTLLEHDLLPNVISGASAGSLVAAIFGTLTERDLDDLIKPVKLIAEARKEVSWFNRALFGKQPRIETADLEEMIARLVPDMTFQEAFELTGRYINISVAPAELHQRSRLLNAIASPNVYIRSAVMASCAVPGVFPAVMLEAKNYKGERQPYLPTRRWVDGSVTDDLPARRLARMYGVNHFIGSLINPMVMFTRQGAGGRSSLRAGVRQLGRELTSLIARNSRTLAREYTRRFPRFNLMLNMTVSVLNQDYSADINIYPEFRQFNMRKILSHLGEEELLALVKQGERATWPKLDQIRISTGISHTLDRILEDYGQEEHRLLARRANGRGGQKAISAKRPAAGPDSAETGGHRPDYAAP